jgi:hypothetical protein
MGEAMLATGDAFTEDPGCPSSGRGNAPIGHTTPRRPVCLQIDRKADMAPTIDFPAGPKRFRGHCI